MTEHLNVKRVSGKDFDRALKISNADLTFPFLMGINCALLKIDPYSDQSDMQIQIAIDLTAADLIEGACDKFKSKYQTSENNTLVEKSHLADTKSK